MASKLTARKVETAEPDKNGALADAREKAAGARRKIVQGLNPIDERKRAGGILTLGEVANDVREALSAGLSGAQATGGRRLRG